MTELAGLEQAGVRSKSVFALRSPRPLWVLAVLLLVAMELTGVYVQYVMGYEPCLICVQERALMGIMLIAAAVGMVLNADKWFGAVLGGIMTIAGGTATYLAWSAWDLEKNPPLFSPCVGTEPFPFGLALDRWFPSFFEPRGICGEVIPFIGGFTFSDVILAGLAVATVISAGATIWVARR